MQFRLLGPVELRAGTEVVPLGKPKQRAVLAVLLLDVGVPVSPEALIDRVWDEAPPPEVRSALYSHVARIRRLLHDVAARTGQPARLERRSGGYVVEVAPDTIDVVRARRLVARGSAPDAPPQQRSADLRAALALWRGEPLGGIAGRWADQTRAELAGLRLAALQRWAELELQLRRPAAVIDEVGAALTRHPLAEALIAVQMRALFLAGRGAEALELYASARRRFAEELGTEPGAELREIHEAMLRGEFTPVRGAPPPVAAAPPVPRQLPADVAPFTGRRAELDRLDRLLAGAGGAGTAAPVAAVSGTAGVGKTALAVHWAHRVAGRFPDGHLYLDLRGYDPDQPVAAADALAAALRALGVARMPADLAERAGLYRTLLADRRMLVVLDNAAGADHVRPLLPGGAGCFTVVTSRDSLAALVARHGAQRLELDLLTAPEALALLGALVGERIEADPAGAAALADRCARLPLALRIVAEHLIAHTALAPVDLAAALADERLRLDLLDAGAAERTAVRSVFSWSYGRLDPAVARAFRLLGLNPGADIGTPAVAALLGTAPPDAARLLAALTRAHLVRQVRPGRFAMHDLLRTFAVECLAGEPEPDRRAALVRLLDHLQHVAAAAVDAAFPDHGSRRSMADPAAPGGPVAARDWLGAERDNLVAASELAVAYGLTRHVVGLAAAVNRDLDSGGRWGDAVAMHERAVAASVELGDQLAEAEARHNLGTAQWRLGYADAALEQYRRALAAARQVGDAARQARTLNNAAAVSWCAGDYDAAVRQLAWAVALHERTGNRALAAVSTCNLGAISSQRGRYPEAMRYCQRALGPVREGGYLIAEAVILDTIGTVHRRQGRYAEALRSHRQSLNLARMIGDRTTEANAIDSLGVMHRLTGYAVAALRSHEEALAIRRAAGDRAGEADARDNLGLALVAAGRAADAVVEHRRALELLRAIGDRRYEPKACNGLAEALWTAGDVEEAREHFAAARKLAAAMDVRYEWARALHGSGVAAAAGGDRDEAARLRAEAAELFAALEVPLAHQARDRPAALG